MNLPVKATVTQRFTAPPGQVYDAWLSTEWIGRWMFGPNVRHERIVRLGIEPRVGGKFSFVVDRGGTEIDHVGTYLVLDRPQRLVFTWSTRATLPQTSRVTVEITPIDGGCWLMLTHEMGAEWTSFVDRSAGAWRKMLDALNAALS